LLGSWFIIFDELTGQAGKNFGLHYYHFAKLMFPVHADTIYLLTLSYYACFIIIIQLSILFFAKSKSNTGENEIIPININHFLLISACVISAIISFLLVWREILTAAKFHQSIYVITRHRPSKFFTIHQLLNEISVIALYIGLISAISGSNSKFIYGDNRKTILILYIIAVALIEFYLLLLGNKREILFGGILAVIFYFNNIRSRVNLKVLSLFLFIIILPLIFNDGFRSYSPTFLTNYFDVSDIETPVFEKEIVYTEFTIKNSSIAFLFSNEMFCSHFSMYGVLSKNIPLTYGSSLVSFFASLIPHDLWPGRPETIYDYYFKEINAEPGQGYTIHHSTGWYLNFGIWGIILGAMIFGFFWSWLYNRFRSLSKVRNNFLKILFMLGISAFTAQIPTLIRTGPEGYKVMIFEALLLPALIIYISTFHFKKEK
jgi:hypothetical protein